ncbi:MAG: lytic transglycosylase domain-containing protein [Rhodobacteraceae bacterium]|nr:lytic transglycosylase domain-containing protein [Paracoccaceae bacterium]
MRRFNIWAVLLFLCTPALAEQSEADGNFLAIAWSAAAAGDWNTADHYASEMKDGLGRVLITWHRLRRGEGGWEEYLAFLENHGDWPGLKRLRQRGEAVIPAGYDPATVRAYFADQLPQTGVGSLRLAEAYAEQGRTSEARSEVQRAWTSLALTRFEEEKLLDKYRGTLEQHHLKRLEFLLWNDYTKAAERHLSRVPPARQKLAKARIALQRAAADVDTLIKAVPDALRDDPGLAFDRFRWRVKKNRWDDAQKLLVKQSADIAKLGMPGKWADWRRIFARRAMRADEEVLAYWLASRHGLSAGAHYADLEWISGYVALTSLDAPEQALVHFKNYQAAVKTPISLGRAGYWVGRAEEMRKDFHAAADAFNAGAKHQTSFYGQLSAERLGIAGDLGLIGKSDVPSWRETEFLNRDVVRAAMLFHFAEEPGMMRWFFSHIAETMTATEAAQLADLALDLGRPYVALGVAKDAARRGIVIPRSYFPVTELADFSSDVAPEVALAIARRESEFNPEAVSPAGARGLMQVMPATAREVAGKIGMDYSRNRLTTDWHYNANLGTAYLGGLLDLYEGSYILAFAAYNAGPHRAEQWIERFGDPRDSRVDRIHWIEHIPFRETRNYVMRVMESLHVYRMRLTGAAEPVRISEDLLRGVNGLRSDITPHKPILLIPPAHARP